LAEPICRGLHEVKGFYAVIFRRTSKQVTEPGALWDQAGKIYPHVGGTAHVGSLEYRFASGARIAFRHIQHEEDKHNYAGSEICYLGFDELYLFTESQFTFLLSRNRSVCGVAPYVRATSNPHPGWLRTFIAPWVDDEFQGERAASGEIRHQVRIKGKIQWVPKGTPQAKSVTFMPAKLKDNPTLIEGDPTYEATLHSLLPIEQERLLHGNWATLSEGLVYPEALDPAYGCLVESEGLRGGVPDEGGMDFGLTAPFVALWGYTDYDDVMWFTGERHVRGVTIPEHSKRLPDCDASGNVSGAIEWHADPAGAQEIAQLRALGHDVKPCVHVPTRGATGETKSPKRSGIDVVRHRMRTGRLRIVRTACPNLVRELGMYINDPDKPDSEEPLKEHDHAPDAMRYRCVGHDRRSYGEPYIPPESDEAKKARETKEASDKLADIARKKALDESRERSIFDDERWGR